MEQRTETAVAALVILAVAAVAYGAIAGVGEVTESEEVSTFDDADDFRSYLQQAPESSGSIIGSGAQGRPPREDVAMEEADAAAGGDGGGYTSDRVDRESTTNVQVEGIDEPDILKNHGGRLFYSADQTRVIDAVPPEEMELQTNVSRSGDMLLDGDRLVVFDGDEVAAYDVSTETPEERWTASLDSSLVTARLTDGTVYLVLSGDVDRENPCPVRPMEAADGAVVVPCDRIHHPVEPVDVDTTYDVVALDLDTGEQEGATSFVGSAANSVVHVDGDSVYVTYRRTMSETDVMLEFATTEARDLLDDPTVERLEEIQGYDLGPRSKRLEVERAIEGWQSGLDEDERLEKRNEFENRFRSYVKDNLREFESTGIVRVDAESLEVEASTEVPGRLVGQFALDEHDGHLRVATTVGESISRDDAENDVYVLDDSLRTVSSVKGLGVGQRIYSVRFQGDVGYVVTYRQVDPFYVIDLTDPRNPVVEGELKLPGYSSYLHPLDADRVLGVGEENGRVKAVVFDVSTPTEPEIQDDYVLDEWSSAAVGNHRAFLEDPRHDVFFLPGGKGGYVFSYSDGLDLERAVNVTRAKRAAYIDDTMYVVSDTEVVALDESDWSRVGRLQHGEEQPHPRYWREEDAARP